MKKHYSKLISSLLSVLILFMSAFTFAGFTNDEAAQTAINNKTCEYSLSDAVKVQRYCAYFENLSKNQCSLYDVNFDGFVSIGDATLIQMHVAQIIDINSDEYQSRRPADSVKPTPDEGIPEYIDKEAKRLAQVVKSHQSENSVSFICCSDLHEDGTQTVSKHNAMGAYLVREYADIDFGVFLGDHIRGAPVDSEETSIAQYNIVLPQLAWWCDAPVNGNHDNGMGWWDGYLTSDMLYQFIGSRALNVVRPQTEADRGYYYFDLPQKNLRVIMLNTNDLKGVDISDHSVSGSYNDGHRVSVPQLNWFAQTLAEIPAGYSFIVCSHEPIHWYNYTYTDSNNVTWDMAQNWRTILDACVGKTSYDFTQDGQTVSGDFSKRKNTVLVGTFHGHTHNYIDDTYGANNIVRVSTPNACNGRTNEYGIVEIYGRGFAENYGELDENGNRVTDYLKTKEGTANETALVVNTIDFEKKIIYSDHYGAGHDRVISYQK